MFKWLARIFGSGADKETSGGTNTPQYLDISKHFRRMIEIEEALAEVGPLFERFTGNLVTSASTENLTSQIVNDVNNLRIPGFFAYHLAQEGIALLHMITAAGAILRTSPDSLDADKSAQIENIMNHLKEVEPLMRQALYDMEPFRNMNATETVEMLVARITQLKS
jgi:hypothetical protein